MLRLSSLSFSYGESLILKDMNLKIQPGELVAILGPSGTGKSTLFSLLIGDELIQSGEILLNDISLRDLSFNGLQEYRRNIGVIFQDFLLLDTKTVQENITFALEVSGAHSEGHQKIDDLLKIVGLEKKKNHFPHMLSGGERQRVAIARSLIHNPEIIIADEPTGNVDPKNAIMIGSILKTINKEFNTTIITATHDPVFVQKLNPRIIRLENGSILFDKEGIDINQAFKGLV